MSIYEVHAVWRGKAWEVEVPEVGTGRAPSLSRVRRLARELIEAHLNDDVADDAVVIKPFVGGIEDGVLLVKKEIEELAITQVKVAQHSRDVARALRDRGLSGADIAVVLGVSPQRVSQLKHT